MAVGKNKRLSKGKKGGKKKQYVVVFVANAPAPQTPSPSRGLATLSHLAPSRSALCLSSLLAPRFSHSRSLRRPHPPPLRRQDPFAKKDWYDIKAPTMFNIKNVGKTLVTRTQGTKIASDGLKGRVINVSLADLQKNESDAHRNIKLRVEDVQGRNCLTNFYGMDLTTDKLRSLVRKWQTLIEAHVDVKTTDGYYLRMFCIAFTKKRQGQVKKTAYARSSQIRQIRAKMVEIMTREATSCDLKELVGKFIPEAIGKEIEKACQGIYPLQNTFVRKVKLLRAPKFDVQKLMEVHGDYSQDAIVSEVIERPAEDVVGMEETAAAE